MKHLETAVPGLLVIVLAVLLFILGDRTEQTNGIAAGLAILGIGMLRSADANKVVEKPIEQQAQKPPEAPSIPGKE